MGRIHVVSVCSAAAVAVIAFAGSAHALSITTVDPASSPAAALAAATLGASSGISIVSGSETYLGVNEQGGTYSDFSLSNSSDTVALSNNGIVLTSGDATGILVPTNTDSSFDGSLGTAGDADLASLVSSSTYDANYLSFEFTVSADITSVSAEFVFGTDEYPDQSVTDIFGVFVDGVNYAEFSDGSVINFELGSISSGFFNDNDVGSLDPYTEAGGSGFQYDGILDVLYVVGLLDTSLTTHTIKIAISDTSDTIFDSGVFIGGLTAGTDTGGGITPGEPGIPVPATLALLIPGLVGVGAMARRRARS